MTAKRNPTARPRKTSAKAPRQPRKKPTRRLKPRTLAWLVGGGLASLLLLAGWQTGFFARQLQYAEELLLDATASAGLELANVEVRGRVRTPSDQILAALNVKQGQPLLAFDPYAARQALEALPWVRQAEVERHLPNLVRVTLEERVPLALWQLEGVISVIDDQGVVIPGVAVEDFATLPLVVGRGAESEAADLLAMLELESSLAAKVEAAVRVSERRWNLRLKNGIDIALPAEDPAAALARLIELDQSDQLLSRDLVLIDLRQPDRLVLRLAPGAQTTTPPAASGEDT